MRLPKWVGSALKIGTSWIPGVGTAVEEGLDHLKEHQDRRSMIASLLDLEEQKWRPDASPAALLRADFGVVPFHGREAELQDLARWCDSDRPLALRLYTAPGGFGKTRLLRHFVRVRRDEWHTGFLPEGKLTPEAIEALLGAGKKPLLLVLDYAESRVNEIEALIRAATATPRPRVRMVLLARAEGDWWSGLKRAGDGVGDFFQGPAVEGPISLPPLTDSMEARGASYQNAVRAFARTLGKEPTAALSLNPPLGHEDFERVLLVHAAALAAVEGENVASDTLLDWLLTREERGLDRVREMQAGLGPEIQRALHHAATLVTLAQGADSRDEVVEIISRAPSLKDQPRARREQVAEVLHVLYKARRWCDGVEPDLVGEQLASSSLHEAPELLAQAFGEDVPEERLEAGLTLLNRLAQRRPGDRRLLEEAIGKGLRHLALPALRVAVAGGDPIGLIMAQALNVSGDLEVARQLEPHFPDLTVSLREVAVEVEELLWRDERERSADPAELARRSDVLSVRRAYVGLTAEALRASREAVEIYRNLAEAQPSLYRADLVSSLNNLSNRLADVGLRETALEVSLECVAITRDLAEERPDAFRPTLALSLNNLSERLADLGREEEALESVREAVEIYRAGSGASLDAFKPNLAATLNNFSNRLTKGGRAEEASETIREAVDLYRDLAETRPDAFRPHLATALSNLSSRLIRDGQREKGLEAIRESVEIYSELAKTRPDVFKPDLALTLHNLATILSFLDRPREAEAAIRTAIDLRRSLAEAQPDAFTPELAMSLALLQLLLRESGQTDSALQVIQEALDLLEPIFSELPQAHARAMRTIIRGYEGSAVECGVEFERERMDRIRAILAELPT